MLRECWPFVRMRMPCVALALLQSLSPCELVQLATMVLGGLEQSYSIYSST
jgi:hypothetical protein